MRRCARKQLPLAVSLLTLPLAGCSTLISENRIPADAKVTAEAIGHVRPSRRDTCETRQQIAAQSSRLDTIIQGKEVVYKDDCKPAATVKATS